MYALHGEGKYVIPLLLIVPKTGSGFSTIIYIHPDGKLTDALPGGRIEQLVRKGYMVAAPDVIGTGEVGPDNINSPAYVSLMIGRSIAGIQAGDIVRVVNFLKTRNDVNTGKISGMAYGNMGPALLHAATFDKSIGSVTLIESLISYRSIVMNRFYETGYADYAVAGMLTAYDLPDLIGSIAPRKVALAGLTDHLKKPASKALIDEELLFPQSVYRSVNVSGNLIVSPSGGDITKLAGWSFE
jgi:hypothetical protein